MLDKCLNQISDGSPGIENRVPETTSQSTITAALAIVLYSYGFACAREWFERFDGVCGPSLDKWEELRRDSLKCLFRLED